MQGTRIERRSGHLRSTRRDVQLLVAVVEEIEPLVEQPGAQQLTAHRRTCAIGTDHDIGTGANLAAPGFEHHLSRRRVELDELMVEHDLPRGPVLGGIEQGMIERRPTDRVDRQVTAGEYGWKSSGPCTGWIIRPRIGKASAMT